MTLDQLNVLHTILEKGSFRAASEALHRAQSAVSYAIKNLEEELNLQIFTREGYRPKLTIEGKAIYEKAKLVLLQANELNQLAKQLSMGEEPEIKVAINAVCPISCFIKIINRFSKEHPTTQIKLTMENLGGAIERLLDGDADLAISEMSMIEWNDQIEGIPITKIQFIPTSAPEYPPAQSKRELQKSDMVPYVQILVSDTSRHQEGKTVGVVQGGVHWTVNDFSVKKKLLIEGSGWGLMPMHMVEEEIKSGALVKLNYRPYAHMEIMEAPLFLIRKKGSPVGPMMHKLWESLQTMKDSNREFPKTNAEAEKLVAKHLAKQKA